MHDSENSVLSVSWSAILPRFIEFWWAVSRPRGFLQQCNLCVYVGQCDFVRMERWTLKASGESRSFLYEIWGKLLTSFSTRIRLLALPILTYI